MKEFPGSFPPFCSVADVPICWFQGEVYSGISVEGWSNARMQIQGHPFDLEMSLDAAELYEDS